MRSVFILLSTSVIAYAQIYHIPSPSVPIEELPPLPTLFKRQQYHEPCEEVSASWAAQMAQATGESAPQIWVPAQVAYDCLQSVPVDQGDILEIQELKEFLQYQSTLSYLKSGVERHNKPLDLIKSLDEIAERVRNGAYNSDYEVQLSIRLLLDSAEDFHLYFLPDITTVFQFIRSGGRIVSISKDGISLPELYLNSDLVQLKASNFTPSPITTINGENATSYLYKVSVQSTYHDPDARYNTLFPNPARGTISTDTGGMFSSNYVFDGPVTTFIFANGTKKTIENMAFIPSIFNFHNVTDGASFFDAFCQGPPEEIEPPQATSTTNVTLPETTPVKTPTATPTPIGYPKPVFVQESLQLQGYYVNGSGYEDVAVLVLPGFQPTKIVANSTLTPGAEGIIDSQNLLRTFFSDSSKNGKKKLIIDLRGNGGGTIDMGFDLFKQLFPTIEPFGASRYRAHEALLIYSNVVTDLAENVTANASETAQQSTFYYKNLLDVNNQPFKTFQDYYGPHVVHNDTFMSVRRYNFSNDLGGHTTVVGLTGYNGPAASTQPFQSENIVILQDGFCGSTCAIFSELMREQGKVQTIAVGGRPMNTPMQGVGGSKGSQVLSFDTIYNFALNTLSNAEELYGLDTAQKLNKTTAAGRIANTQQLFKRSTRLITEHLSGSVNSLDNLRQNDTTETALEFVYEAADCRLFYTAKSYLDPVPLWKQAIDTKWGNGKCVNGSIEDATAIGVVNNEPFNKQNKKTTP